MSCLEDILPPVVAAASRVAVLGQRSLSSCERMSEAEGRGKVAEKDPPWVLGNRYWLRLEKQHIGTRLNLNR